MMDYEASLYIASIGGEGIITAKDVPDLKKRRTTSL